jgi:hypothetical protein
MNAASVVEKPCTCCGHNTWQVFRGFRVCAKCDRLEVRMTRKEKPS